MKESCKLSSTVPWFIALTIATIAAASLTVGKVYAQGAKLIGIIVSSPDNWFEEEIAKAADAKAKQLGYETLVLYHEEKVDPQENNSER